MVTKRHDVFVTRFRNLIQNLFNNYKKEAAQQGLRIIELMKLATGQIM